MSDDSTHEVLLGGCRITPLAGYLKGLAVLRLVSEQVDRTARAAWRGDALLLRSSLDQEGLLDFFLDRYEPTPIVSPWNGGSGFAANDNQDGIGGIEQSDSSRFAAYRSVIEQVRAWPEMPRRYSTVGEMVADIEDVVRVARPGKARDKRQRLLDQERRARRAAGEVLGDAASLDSGIDWLLQATRELTGPQKRAAADWWKVVRKLATDCASLSRGQSKELILKAARARLPEKSLAWLDATYAIRADDSVSYPPLLGTGGNDGRLDLSNNFMQRLIDLLGEGRDRSLASRQLATSLLGVPSSDLPKTKIGQYDPGRAGGYNQGAEFETKDFKASPWDFVLSLEGATSLGSSVHRRMAGDPRGTISAPFTVHYSGAGFASSASSEEGKGELWLPVWRRPARYGEVQQLFREGRSTVGRREARTGLDFTRAVRTLGVSRGVDAFERYAFVVRRGKSPVALPAGRLPVRFDRRVRLLDDLDPILDHADQFLRMLSSSLPASLVSLRRQIDEASYECARSPTPERFGDLIAILGALEHVLASRAASGAKTPPRPLSGLRPQWILACDDGSVEVRVAAALASIRGDRKHKVGPIRSNLAGVDPGRPWEWASGHGQRRWVGSNLVQRLGGVLVQRLMDANRYGVAETPLSAAMPLSPHDVVPLLYGDTDDRRIESLLWGFGLVEWHHQEDHEARANLYRAWSKPLARIPVPRGYALLKLLHWPGPLRGELLRREPRIASLLQADRAEDALDVARHRLRVAGLTPLPVAAADDVTPARLLAALLVPLRHAAALERLVLARQQTDRPQRDRPQTTPNSLDLASRGQPSSSNH